MPARNKNGDLKDADLKKRDSQNPDSQNPDSKNSDLKSRLSRSSEINLSVTGRKSGRRISRPVWFVLDDHKLYLVPVEGSVTQWYKNVLKNPTIGIDAPGAQVEVRAVPIVDRQQVSSVVEKFRAKYGSDDVKKYYSKFDVAVVAELK